jgi:hypothetical protein
MRYRTIGTAPETRREVSVLALGAMLFGSRTDEATSFAVLDRYVEAGGNFIDTSDNYAFWVDGSQGGQSEKLLGRWRRSRGIGDEIVIATKLGARPLAPGTGFVDNPEGLSAKVIRESAERSRERLGVEKLDLLYAHIEDHERSAAGNRRRIRRVGRRGHRRSPRRQQPRRLARGTGPRARRRGRAARLRGPPVPAQLSAPPDDLPSELFPDGSLGSAARTCSAICAPSPPSPWSPTHPCWPAPTPRGQAPARRLRPPGHPRPPRRAAGGGEGDRGECQPGGAGLAVGRTAADRPARGGVVGGPAGGEPRGRGPGVDGGAAGGAGSRTARSRGPGWRGGSRRGWRECRGCRGCRRHRRHRAPLPTPADAGHARTSWFGGCAEWPGWPGCAGAAEARWGVRGVRLRGEGSAQRARTQADDPARRAPSPAAGPARRACRPGVPFRTARRPGVRLPTAHGPRSPKPEAHPPKASRGSRASKASKASRAEAQAPELPSPAPKKPTPEPHSPAQPAPGAPVAPGVPAAPVPVALAVAMPAGQRHRHAHRRGPARRRGPRLPPDGAEVGECVRAEGAARQRGERREGQPAEERRERHVPGGPGA